MSQPAKTVITLVHGTWASHAAWTEPTSKLCDELTRHLPTPVITSFGWSGKNSVDARAKAAQDLAAVLNKQIKDNPCATHFVIGHSHGGNVALRAVELGALFDVVRVVCLSTPFFHVTPRNFGDKAEKSALQFGVITALLTLWWYLLLEMWSVVFSVSFRWDELGLLPFFSALPLLFVGLILVGRVKKRVDKIVGEITIAIPETAQLMIIRSVGDEALIGIAAFQFVEWLMTSFMRAYLRIMTLVYGRLTVFSEALERRQFMKKTLWLTAVGIVFSIAFDLLTPVNMSKRQAALLVTVTLLAVSLGLFQAAIEAAAYVPLIAIGITFAPVALGIMTCAILPMGRDIFTTILFHEVTVESVPTGKWVIYQIVPVASDRLNHSAPYDDLKALTEMRQWMAAPPTGLGSSCEPPSRD